jgi:DNA polymerase-3 subunit gamma/tau
VGEVVVHTMLGAIDRGYLFGLLEALHEQNGAGILEIADNMSARSLAFDAALQELASLLHRIALSQSMPQAIAEDEPERTRLLELARVFTAEEIQLYYQIAIHGRDEIDLAPDEYAGFTMTLLRMLAFAPPAKGITLPSLDATSAKVQPSAKPSVPDGNAVTTKPAGFQTKPAPDIKSSIRKADSGDQPDWGVLLTQLNVQGMAQQLAKHCVLENFSDRQITLRLSQEHKHLQTNKAAIEKLRAALASYLAKPVKLNIVLGESGSETPAVIEQQNKHLKQQQASDSITHDRFVQDAQIELDASLIDESIKPVQ